MEKATKEFEVQQGSTKNMYYCIRVFFRGKLIDEFLRPTQREALRDFELAGYTMR